MNRTNIFLIFILIKFIFRNTLYVNKLNKNKFVKDLSYKKQIKLTNKLKYSKYNNKGNKDKRLQRGCLPIILMNIYFLIFICFGYIFPIFIFLFLL